MAFESANKPLTNSKTEIVNIRMAENAAYLTVASKKYLGDQLVGKRNGQDYTFVIRDAGATYEGLEIEDSDINHIEEREVKLGLENNGIAVGTNVVETKTDIDFDQEIAEPNAQKLMNDIVRKQIGKDIGKVGCAFVGSGFAPLSQASAHLATVTSEEAKGFIDPNVEAILTSNGQQFVPVNAPDMYSKGLLGKFHGVEYRAQRFFPNVKVSEALATEFESATVTSYVDNGDKTATITLSGVTEAMPKGFVFWIDGVYGCDLVGDALSMEKAWVVIEKSENGAAKVVAVDMAGNGTREVAGEDNEKLTASDFAGKKVSCPEAGLYFSGIIRTPSAYEFETLNEIDCKGTDYEKSSIEGVCAHKNTLTDIKTMKNVTRWDMLSVAGVVEPRCQTYILIK